MKIHITNLYNFNKGDIMVQKQHEIADVARTLGFLDMGIFSFPVETDSVSELNKRMDGIIASLEAKDVVIIQLPTENGYSYEQLLANKIKAYSDTRIVFWLHDFQYILDGQNQNVKQDYINLFRLADAIVIPTVREASVLKKQGFTKLFYMDDIDLSRKLENIQRTNFYIKKLLIDVVACILDSDSSNIKNVDDAIHIGFGLHDKFGDYSIWVGAVIQSIVENTSANVCFHILHDDTLTEKNRTRLIEVAERSGNIIWFHHIDEIVFGDLSEKAKSFTIGAMFRIMLPELLSDISKIIYLDADLIVYRDIKELWDIDISDYCLAAVADMVPNNKSAVIENQVKAECYFNSGVLYLNLDKIREKGDMKALVLDYLIHNPKAEFPDQDALNAIYANETLLIDGCWNYFADVERNNVDKDIKPRIYHFAGTRCYLYYNSAIDWLYYQIISRTPWKDDFCTSILSRSMDRVTDRINLRNVVLHKVNSEDVRKIYYGDENFGMKNLYKLFQPKKGDYRISDKPNIKESSILPCKELDEIKNEKNTYVVFVSADADEGRGIAKLEHMGLKNERDFFVTQRILDPHEGGFR